MSDHQEAVQSIETTSGRIDAVLHWQGKEPEDDTGRYLDLYDQHGNCINEGEPWHFEGGVVPSKAAMRIFVSTLGY